MEKFYLVTVHDNERDAYYQFLDFRIKFNHFFFEEELKCPYCNYSQILLPSITKQQLTSLSFINAMHLDCQPYQIQILKSTSDKIKQKSTGSVVKDLKIQEKLYLQRISENPTSVLFESLGNFYRYQNKYDLAIENYQKAVEMGDKDPTTWFYLGKIFLDRYKYSKAMDYFERAIQIQKQTSKLNADRAFKKVLDSYIVSTQEFMLKKEEHVPYIVKTARITIKCSECGKITDNIRKHLLKSHNELILLANEAKRQIKRSVKINN